jgi:hypothetical protein
VFVLRQYQDFKQTWLHFCVCPKTVPRFQTNMVTFLCFSQDSTKISNKHGYISVFLPRQYQDFKQTWLHFCVCSHLNMSMEYNYKITSNIPRKLLQMYNLGPEKKKKMKNETTNSLKIYYL